MASLGWAGVSLSWKIGLGYILSMASGGWRLDPKQPLPSPLEISGSGKNG
jgi:hypothetical protein